MTSCCCCCYQSRSTIIDGDSVTPDYYNMSYLDILPISDHRYEWQQSCCVWDSGDRPIGHLEVLSPQSRRRDLPTTCESRVHTNDRLCYSVRRLDVGVLIVVPGSAGSTHSGKSITIGASATPMSQLYSSEL